MKRGHENSNISGDIKGVPHKSPDRKVQIPEIKVQIRIRKVNWQEKNEKKIKDHAGIAVKKEHVYKIGLVFE